MVQGTTMSTMSLFVSQRETNNVNVKVVENFNKNELRRERVDRIADRLVNTYHAKGSRAFFCKCAMNLSEYQIDTVVASSFKANIISPVKYFVATCHHLMNKR